MLNGSDHQVTHILACDATSGGEEAHGFTITAVEREGDPHLLSILAADLKAVGAPTPIAFIHCDPTIVPPLDTTGMAIEQQAMDLHHPVDPFVIGHLAPEGQRLALEDGVDTPVAVSRQLGDNFLDLGHQRRRRWTDVMITPVGGARRFDRSRQRRRGGPASDYRALQNQVRELHRLLGKKTLETEILKEALEDVTGSSASDRRRCKGW